jgi:ATP-binding cassette, subfamily B, multidrug efflux pump
MKSLRRIMAYMQSYRLAVVFGVLTVILPVAMELLVPRVLQYIVDKGIRGGDMSTIVRGSAIMLVAAIVGAAATLGQGLCRAVLSQGLAFDIRNDLFRHIQSLSFGKLDQMQTGGLMTRISSDVNLVRMFSSNGLALMLRAILMILGSLIMVFLLNTRLALVMVACLGLAAFVITGFTRKVRPLFAVVQEKLSALNTVLQESLAGIRVVKAFVRERFEIGRFGEYSQDYMAQHIRVGRITALVTPFLAILTNVSIVAVVLIGGRGVIGGRLTLGELIAFTNFFMIGMTPLMLLGNMVSMVSRAEASSDRIMEIFDMEPGMGLVGSPHSPVDMSGNLTVEDVHFHYPGTDSEDANILEGVQFEAKAGQQIALLGATGAGKSSLVHLLPRFYDVTSGSIRVDDTDVRGWSPEALRASIALVMQQPILFSGTVHQNIAYGRPDASFEDVVSAAKAAQAHGFVMQMPGEYGAKIEARGANLSGGQKQRLAIARAILINPSILILDDSTSSVDVETEFKIQDALAEREKRSTTIIIAQRINSVLDADKIIILDAGKIVSEGTHGELMENSEQYREIYRSQFGEIGHA